MEFKGSKTEANLTALFASKAFQKNMYDSYAYRFAYSGHQQVQNAMYDAGKVESAHAKIIYELLNGPVKDTKTNLATVIADEIAVGAEYRECAATARAEGLNEAATYFEETAKVHDEHVAMYEQILYNFENDKVFNKDEKVDWVCVACGIVVHDHTPGEECPYCEHPKGLFYIKPTNF